MLKKLLLLLLSSLNCIAIYPPINSGLFPVCPISQSSKKLPFDNGPIIPQFSADGAHVFALVAVRTVYPQWYLTEWDYEGNKLERLLPHAVLAPLSLSCSNDGKNFVVVSDAYNNQSKFDCDLFYSVPQSFKHRYKLTQSIENLIAVCNGAMHSRGAYWAVSFQSSLGIWIQLWETESGTQLFEWIAPGNKPLELAWMEDKLVGYQQGSGDTLFVWRIGETKPERIVRVMGAHIDTIATYNKSEQIAIAHSQGSLSKVSVFDSGNNQIFTQELDSICLWLGFNTEGSQIAAMTEQHTFYLWSKASHKLLMKKNVNNGKRWDISVFDFKWIKNELVRWVFANCITGEIGT